MMVSFLFSSIYVLSDNYPITQPRFFPQNIYKLPFFKSLMDVPPIEIPEDLKKKFEELKTKLEKFKDQAIKEHKEIIGITILPPPKENIDKATGKKIDKNIIDVLVLVDAVAVETKDLFQFRKSVFSSLDKIALSIDKNIRPQPLLVEELKENCFDGKYEILNLISYGTPLYDSKDMLAAIKVAEIHKEMVLKKFEKYIVSYVAAGSLFRGEKSHDIDVYLVVDDTDVKRMSRFELKERLRNMIISQGYEAADIAGVKKLFHIQVYILTDFWESIKDAHPVIFTFLRDGVPLYDKGLFMSWKLLLAMGRIRPSPEAIDVHMDMGEKLIDRAKKTFIRIAAEDLYYAILNPSQAALMLYGVSPPTPRETAQLMREIFVQKEKLLEPRYLTTLEKIVKLYKDVEYGKILELKGAQLDSYIKEIEIYLKRIRKLFDQIEKKQESQTIVDIYNTCIKVTTDALTVAGIKVKDIEKDFEEYAKKSNISEKFVTTLKEIIKAQKEYKARKLRKAEAEKIKREARTFIRLMIDHLQQKKSYEIEKLKVHFRYGKKFGEALILNKEVFIIKDLEAKDKQVMKAELKEDCSFGNIKKITMAELEEALGKITVTEKTFVKERFFEDLKRMIGSEIEIFVNY